MLEANGYRAKLGGRYRCDVFASQVVVNANAVQARNVGILEESNGSLGACGCKRRCNYGGCQSSHGSSPWVVPAFTEETK